MKRVIRNIVTHATLDHAATRRWLFGRDEILHAEPVPKLLLMPTVWAGDLQPVLDSYLEQLKPLENGLSLGRTLSAQEIGHVLDLGRAWLGNMQTKLLAASADFISANRPAEAGTEPGTDVSEVVEQLDRLRLTLGTGDRTKIADGMRRLRDAAGRVSDSLKPRHTGDRRTADATRQRIAGINDHNRQFWGKRTVTPQLDSAGRLSWPTGDSVAPRDRTAVRDAQHAAAHAASPRERIEAMNAGAKAFWSSGEPPAITRDTRPTVPSGAGTIAKMNAANRAFWAGRP